MIFHLLINESPPPTWKFALNSCGNYTSDFTITDKIINVNHFEYQLEFIAMDRYLQFLNWKSLNIRI